MQDWPLITVFDVFDDNEEDGDLVDVEVEEVLDHNDAGQVLDDGEDGEVVSTVNHDLAAYDNTDVLDSLSAIQDVCRVILIEFDLLWHGCV